MEAEKFSYNLEEGRQLWLNTSPQDTTLPELWDNVYKYIFDHCDLPEPELYDILTAWTLCTWVAPKFPVTSYLKFIAPKSSGKTRVLDTLYQLCFRAIKSSTLSPASVYRILEKWDLTLILDETERYMGDDDMLGILNAGYKKGDYAIRVTDPIKNELGLYKTLGFKALAGTEELKDTLESRCIVINMQKSIRPVRFTMDEKRGAELRGNLMYASSHLLNNLNELNGLPEALEFSNGRFAELYSPLVHMGEYCGHSENIVKYAEDVWEAYQDEEEVSVEAQVLIALISAEKCIEGNPGRISTTHVTDFFNMNRSVRESWKPSSIGRVLTRMGFRPKRLNNGRKGYLFNYQRINRLKERYNV